MAMAEMEKHPDSYMNDGPFINKLLIPVGINAAFLYQCNL